MTQGHRKPGGTPLTGVTFSNGRPYPVQFTVQATNTGGVNLGTCAMRSCPAKANGTNGSDTYSPPSDWEDVCSLVVTVYPPPQNPNKGSLGAVPAVTTAAAPPNPRPVASTATCTLAPYVNSTTNDCAVQLFDASTPPRVIATGTGVINQNP